MKKLIAAIAVIALVASVSLTMPVHKQGQAKLNKIQTDVTRTFRSDVKVARSFYVERTFTIEGSEFKHYLASIIK